LVGIVIPLVDNVLLSAGVSSTAGEKAWSEEAGCLAGQDGARTTKRKGRCAVGFIEEDIARVRDATDFVAVASEHIALKKVGRQYQGLCPFHSEKSPSFSINPEKGVYFCYGCGAKGDVISFVRDLDHLDFAGAVEKLASKAGIALRYDNESNNKDRVRKTKLFEAMEQATTWYHDRLLNGADAGPARSYLRSRGYDGEAIRRFRIGWAPDGWDTLVRSLKLPSDVARDTGLGFTNKNGKVNDFFQSRILFPIFDTTGNSIAFGGRKLPTADGPKYKNSSETKLYSKSKTLYGLNWAKAGIVAENEVIVCEGYTDVIGFHRAGLARAVATCGTALADEHFRMLKNFARRIVLAYDADNAGQSAAAKFYVWERTYEIDLYVVSLPPGADPADLAGKDPQALADAVRNARPFLQFRIERLLAAANLKTPEGRARAFEQAAEAVFEHPNGLVREQYLRNVAASCQISEETMAATLSGGLAGLAKRTVDPADRTGRGPGAKEAPRKNYKSEPGTGPTSRERPAPGSTGPTNRPGGAPSANRGPAASPPRTSAGAGGNGVNAADGEFNSFGPAPTSNGERLISNSDPGYDAPPDFDDPEGFGERPPSRGFQSSTPGDHARRDQSRPTAPATSARPVRGRASSASTRGAAATRVAARAELEALRWAVQDPSRIVPWLDTTFFADPTLGRAFALLVAHGDIRAAADAVLGAAEDGFEAVQQPQADENRDEQKISRPVADDLDREEPLPNSPDPLDIAAVDVLHRVAVEGPSSEADDAVALMIGNATERAIAVLTAEAMEGDVTNVPTIRELKLLMEHLHESNGRAEALGQLVPWLSAWLHRGNSEK
jgi:DNA primase